jgi:hypothetical protein
MSVQQAEQERLQQEKINAKVISKAQADRDAALEFAKAQEAMVARVRLDIEMIKAQAELEKAKKWDGRLPEKIVPQGASFLFSDERN